VSCSSTHPPPFVASTFDAITAAVTGEHLHTSEKEQDIRPVNQEYTFSKSAYIVVNFAILRYAVYDIRPASIILSHAHCTSSLHSITTTTTTEQPRISTRTHSHPSLSCPSRGSMLLDSSEVHRDSDRRLFVCRRARCFSKLT